MIGMETQMNKDEQYMKRCYELAISAGKKGYDTFGALIVHNDKIVDECDSSAFGMWSNTRSPAQ